MQTINDLELRDEKIFPDETLLRGILGESFDAYCELLKLYERHEMNCEWRYYKDGKAWLCKVQKKKKTVVWMSAWKGFMQATVYIPLKDIDTLFARDLSEAVKDKIRATTDVGKSKPCIFEIRSTALFNDFEKVISFKMK